MRPSCALSRSLLWDFDASSSVFFMCFSCGIFRVLFTFFSRGFDAAVGEGTYFVSHIGYRRAILMLQFMR